MSADSPLRSLRIRPRFTDPLPLDADATRRAILDSLRREPAGVFDVKAFPEFIGIHLAEAQRRHWSPRLFLGFRAMPDGTTQIEGTYGPEMEIWSVFLYGYLLTGLIGAISAIYGGAQLFIGDEPWAFYVTGSMAVIALVLYLAAQLGQKFGAPQTVQLHEAYERAAAPLRASAASTVGAR